VRMAPLMAGIALAALLAAGCSKPPELMMQRLDEKAPAAQGKPNVPGAGDPAPIVDRPPFGLYAVSPTTDTLTRLSTGTLSPDGRFRAVMAGDGPWVTRVDGAWLWQVTVPEPKAPPTTTPGTSTAPPTTTPAQPPKPPRIVGGLEWTSRNTLLMQDDTGAWLEADPVMAKITPMPAFLRGKEGVLFSPDLTQVLYYLPGKNAKQLWVAKPDGTGAKLLGENVTGTWDAAGKPVVTQNPKTPAVPSGVGPVGQ